MQLSREFVEKIVNDFIDDFKVMNGLADCYRYTAIQGIIRFAYMCDGIDRQSRDMYLENLKETIGDFFGDNVVDPFYFAL